MVKNNSSILLIWLSLNFEFILVYSVSKSNDFVLDMIIFIEGIGYEFYMYLCLLRICISLEERKDRK